ncbi:MAG: hypothetical protein ACE5HI_09185 [bacterium]
MLRPASTTVRNEVVVLASFCISLQIACFTETVKSLVGADAKDAQANKVAPADEPLSSKKESNRNPGYLVNYSGLYFDNSKGQGPPISGSNGRGVHC